MDSSAKLLPAGTVVVSTRATIGRVGIARVPLATNQGFKNVIINAEDMLAMHIKRAKNILRVCAYNDVDIFVSGAFGCGAFHNDPCIVAWAWREALKEYREKFDLIDFVIYISDFPAKKPSGEANFYAFRNEFTN